MSQVFHRGYSIENKSDDANAWRVRLQNKVLIGNITAVKKSIDWWTDAAVLIDPAEFNESGELINEGETAENSKVQVQKMEYKGYIFSNDSEQSKEWYFMHGGRLIKGSQKALQDYIDRFNKASKKQ
ncbi:DUF3319 domain-containing protein [Aliivibrio kagoshimensis]|uniref:DUF3319 domain-containing protein n=1 Tax=Aliivibrio kagoshimensis TaxID=2910230 RepID=UPI003D1408F0